MRLSPLIAHRAGAGFAPENTLAGIRACAEMGIDHLEMDVCLLGDNTPVMFHDGLLDRCSDGAGMLRRTDWTTAQHLDVGSWFAPTFKGERMLQLEQALAAVSQCQQWLNLELKVHQDDQVAELVAQVLTALDRQPIAADRLLLSSFEHSALVQLHRAEPDLNVACLFDHLPPTWQQQADEVSPVAIHTNGSYLQPAQARAIKAAGYLLLCYTINDPSHAATLFDVGVDAIFTDHPDLLARELNIEQPRQVALGKSSR